MFLVLLNLKITMTVYLYLHILLFIYENYIFEIRFLLFFFMGRRLFFFKLKK